MDRRYVILDNRGDDGFEEVMPPGTTEEEAIKRLGYLWESLHRLDREKSVMELCHMAVDDDGEPISWDSEGYREALELGYDTLSGYTPIRTMRA